MTINVKYDRILGDLREDDSGNGGGGGGCTDVTYNELVALIGTNGLACGSFYRITDFATVHWLVNGIGIYVEEDDSRVIHTGQNEPLVVLATSANTISTNAWSDTYPQDVIKYDWDSSNWANLPQFVDGDDGITPVTGFKGIITRREDTLLANKVNFDYREITYRLWSIEQAAWDSGTTYDADEFVQNGTIIYMAIDTSTDVEPGVDEGWELVWMEIINLDGFDSPYLSFIPYGFEVGENVIPILDTEVYNDRIMFIDDSSNGNQFDDAVNLPYTVFGEDCGYNTFGAGCGGNTFGANCEDNTFGTDCVGNTFGAGCGSNTFGEDCGYNTFGAGCGGNTFGTYCDGNTFGAGCGYNTFGEDCGSNTFGTGCEGNTFGTECSKNKLEISCISNIFPSCTYMNELKAAITSQDYTSSTPVIDTNITHQISNTGNVYQSYIDDSGAPTFVITSDTIGIWSECPITTTTTTAAP